MNAQIDIPYDRRYEAHLKFDGTYGLLDRINGSVDGAFATHDEAATEAARKNAPRGIPAS